MRLAGEPSALLCITCTLLGNSKSFLGHNSSQSRWLFGIKHIHMELTSDTVLLP